MKKAKRPAASSNEAERSTLFQRFSQEFGAAPGAWSTEQWVKVATAAADWSQLREECETRLHRPAPDWPPEEWERIGRAVLLDENRSARFSKPTASSRGRGRPASARSIGSDATNYQALAAEAWARIKADEKQGLKKLKVKDAVREVMLASAMHECATPDAARAKVAAELERSYTAVRKLLAARKQAT